MKYLACCLLGFILFFSIWWGCQRQSYDTQPVIDVKEEIHSQTFSVPTDLDQKFGVENQETNTKLLEKQSVIESKSKIQRQDINISSDEDQSSNSKEQEKDEQLIDEDKSFSENLKNLNIPDKFNLPEIVVGDKSAPHTLVVYSSFSCNHCCKFHKEEFPKLKTNHIDKGQIKVILRNYIDDLGALEAAILMRFFYAKFGDAVVLYQKIFEKQKEWMSSENPREFLKKIFVEAGYDQKQINNCLDVNGTEYKRISAGLMKDQQKAMHVLHISSVPAFVLDGEVHQGTLSYEEIIEKLGI